MHKEVIHAYISLVKIQGKRSLEGPRCRWEDSIKMNIRIECEGVD
jgi:hypothetical protein